MLGAADLKAVYDAITPGEGGYQGRCTAPLMVVGLARRRTVRTGVGGYSPRGRRMPAVGDSSRGRRHMLLLMYRATSRLPGRPLRDGTERRAAGEVAKPLVAMCEGAHSIPETDDGAAASVRPSSPTPRPPFRKQDGPKQGVSRLWPERVHRDESCL